MAGTVKNDIVETVETLKLHHHVKVTALGEKKLKQKGSHHLRVWARHLYTQKERIA